MASFMRALRRYSRVGGGVWMSGDCASWRGGDFGAAKKTLSEGTYEFVVTKSGWDLVPKKELDRTATKSGAVKNALPR